MKQKIQLIFPQHLIKEPVIFTMARKYDLMPSIQQAKVSETVREIILDLEGSEENLAKGIESLKEQGVIVEFVEGDVPG